MRRNDALTKEAKRLLAALGFPEARALIDPTDDNDVILHRKRAGVSVGAGRFSRAAAESLDRNDLAQWQKAETGHATLCLTEAGRAHLRRAEAPEPEASFFHQHRETVVARVETDSGTKRVRIDAEESPLDWLRRRKGRDGEPMIDAASYQAGERLRTDIMLAGLLPGVTARWDAMPKSGGPVSPADATDRMVAARQRLRSAFDAVGADFSDLLVDLCGFLKGLELIERERHWPARSAKIVVRLALARLAEHYGIETAARGPSASRGIRTWQAVVIEGGRP
ncbi:ATPase [Microvirga sp. BT350]|uniref:ATPase n=1 Tax=Microvirga alba TaxID=2791025 RepID=A0A931BLH5_9HYPH|nr:ATPase [Microvirga alba]